MEPFLNFIDKGNRTLAKIAGWCAILMMAFQAFSVIARYVFSYSIISVQEAVVYGHSILFLFGAAYILQLNQHVRVDVFYSKMSTKLRRKINLIGLMCFVLPVAVTLLYVATPYILNAWQNLEGSRQSGGIAAVFLLKTCIGIFALTLAFQAIAIVIRLLSSKDFDWRDEQEISTPTLWVEK